MGGVAPPSCPTHRTLLVRGIRGQFYCAECSPKDDLDVHVFACTECRRGPSFCAVGARIHSAVETLAIERDLREHRRTRARAFGV